MKRIGTGLAFAALLAFFLAAAPAAAQVFVDSGRTVAVDPARGTDKAVDYASLTRLGPWDDRNYALTAADLALLAPNEAELQTPIPAFFRVALRKANPDSPKDGPVQYPRSAFNAFRILHGGYLLDGMLYPGTTWVGGRYFVEKKDGIPQESFTSGAGFVSGEVRTGSTATWERRCGRF